MPLTHLAVPQARPRHVVETTRTMPTLPFISACMAPKAIAATTIAMTPEARPSLRKPHDRTEKRAPKHQLFGDRRQDHAPNQRDEQRRLGHRPSEGSRVSPRRTRTWVASSSSM